jgi:hypothetical protein
MNTLLLLLFLLSGLPSPGKTLQSLRPKRAGRRRWLVETAAGAVVGLLLPQQASALTPVTKEETENAQARLFRALRPRPPKIIRQRLSKDFAVLLMRSSYNATDSLDFIAMNDFQRDFFIIRSAEYEPYVRSLGQGLVQQGDLTDPYYFDFISFAQYLTINRALSGNPPLIFQEQQPIDQGGDEPMKFEPVVIRRDSQFPNAVLATEHDERVGSAIVEFLDNVFGDTDSRLPRIEPGRRPPADQVLASLQQLVKLFLVNGFAWDGRAELVSNPTGPTTGAGAKFCLTLVSPATIWGGQSLQMQRAKLGNDFLLKAATQLVKRMGYRVASSSVKYEKTNELSYLILK